MRVAKLREGAKIPTKKHPDDAGWDLYAFGEYYIPGSNFRSIPTGVTIEIPRGVVGLIKPKGRSNYLIGAGVVDSGYQGEIVVKVFNNFTRNINIKHGDAFAQIVFLPIYDAGLELDEVRLDKIHQVESLRGGSGGIHEVEVIDPDRGVIFYPQKGIEIVPTFLNGDIVTYSG